MLPLLLASLSAIITSHFFFGSDVLLPFKTADIFSIKDVPFYIILGVVTGLTSVYFTEVYDRIQKFFDRIDSPVKRMLVGGTGLGVLVYFIPPLYGEGFEVINNLIAGNPEEALKNNFMHLDLTNVWIVILLLIGLVFFKVIASALTFGAGGVGGIFAPTLFMGSILGNVVAKIINNTGFSGISESNFTLVGMAGLMAGVLHAPLTAIFLIAEVTGGYGLFIPLMITAAISYSIAKYVHPYSVYAMELGRKGELITHDKDHAVLTLMEIDKVIESNFIAVYPNMSLGEMIKEAVVKSNRNIFPVVDEESNKLLGIILLDDIRPIMFDQTLYNTVVAREVMQKPPEVIAVGKDRMTDIMKKFQKSGAWNLPVIENNKYIGFISKSKLLTAYRNKLIEVTS
jgi:CIC family chloride channel protein